MQTNGEAVKFGTRTLIKYLIAHGPLKSRNQHTNYLKLSLKSLKAPSIYSLKTT